MIDRLAMWIARRLPRRVMYYAINRAMVEGREIFGDRWLFSLHKLDNVRSEYGGCGRFGRKRRDDIHSFPTKEK